MHVARDDLPKPKWRVWYLRYIYNSNAGERWLGNPIVLKYIHTYIWKPIPVRFITINWKQSTSYLSIGKSINCDQLYSEYYIPVKINKSKLHCHMRKFFKCHNEWKIQVCSKIIMYTVTQFPKALKYSEQ